MPSHGIFPWEVNLHPLMSAALAAGGLFTAAPPEVLDTAHRH